MSAVLPVIGALSSSAYAEEGKIADGFVLTGQLQSHLRLFESAAAPGPGGAIVRTDTHVPLVQYLNLNVLHLDSPLGEDTADVELSLWAGAELGDKGYTSRLDGDVQTASVTIHTKGNPRSAWLKFGRQIQAGGAARFARFDGASVGVAITPQLALSVYGGLNVLPRWNQRPGYYHLGSAANSLLTDPEAFEEPSREDYVLVGGRLSFDYEAFRAALSIHEQRENGEIGRRNLGFDAGVPMGKDAFAGASLLLDIDSLKLSTARLFADLALGKLWNLGAEYIKAEPALLLSRQSVLSVFGTAGYHEIGGTVEVRPFEPLRLTGNGYAQFFEDSSPGARLGAAARLASSKRPGATITSLGYTRVEAAELGYHSGRLALSQPLPYRLTATLQGFAYFYDRAIDGYKTSLTGSLSFSYRCAKQWEILWANVASRSPYAALDASTQLRLTYQLSPGSEVTW